MSQSKFYLCLLRRHTVILKWCLPHIKWQWSDAEYPFMCCLRESALDMLSVSHAKGHYLPSKSCCLLFPVSKLTKGYLSTGRWAEEQISFTYLPTDKSFLPVLSQTSELKIIPIGCLRGTPKLYFPNQTHEFLPQVGGNSLSNMLLRFLCWIHWS